MKSIKKFYDFLGSFYFAILLILLTAIFVFAGTVIEAQTDSHLYASYFTYGNPLFIFLLWGFFINILFSAMRRWPFKPRHIPFLITHWGLLMVLGGTLVKSYKGVQGAMGILEGSGNDQIIIPESYVLSIERKPLLDSKYNLKTFASIKNNQLIKNELKKISPKLKIQLLESSPHSVEIIETWIKGNQAFISGLNPMRVYEASSDSAVVPISARVKFSSDPIPPFNVIALSAKDVVKTAKQVYENSSFVRFKDNLTKELLFEGYLKDSLSNPIEFSKGSAQMNLDFSYSLISGFSNPCLRVDSNLFQQKKIEKICIPLEGDNSLRNYNITSPYLGKSPFSIDIERTPTLLFIKDDLNDTYLFFFDSYGRVYSQSFRKDNLTSLMEYDQGFGGYSIQAKIPIGTCHYSRAEHEKLQLEAITLQLRENLGLPSLFSPPLQVLKKACEKAKVDFPNVCVTFLEEWNNSHSWLYPERYPNSDIVKKALEAIDWNSVPTQVKNGCHLTSSLFKSIESYLHEGHNLIEVIEFLNWPLVESLKSLKETPGPYRPEETELLLTTLVQQIFSAGSLLPECHVDDKMSASLLSAYFRLYAIHLNYIEPPVSMFKMKDLTIECPLSVKHLTSLPSLKIENNLPKIFFKIEENNRVEHMSLSYDRYGQGLKWPALEGNYLLRYQSLFHKIPYRIRLRQARQINYPNSLQPYSYESDLIISDLKRNQTIEKTISMNNVFETWDGYRFYLANISPSSEGTVKRVQIIVNYDPAKYWLTYPGAIILVMGIILLFWIKPYAK
jgi:hypothetical protein